MSLSGKVAIVTGSSRGIGKAIALKFSSWGASVTISGRDESAVASCVDEIREKGGSATGIAGDISSLRSATALVEGTLAAWGRVDILVNNAGITRDRLLVQMKDEDWEEVLRVNLTAAFLLCRACARPMLRQRWGRIINISSVGALTGNPGQANYTAAKAGLLGLTRTLARELASRGITANAVCPGFIDTEMTRALPNREELVRSIPLGYPGTGEDVAEVVAFLASPAARYITGQVISVDGGLALV